MTLIRSLLLLLVVPCFAMAADDELKAKVKKDITTLSEATVKGDATVVADLTHPGIHDLIGGRDKLIEVTKNVLKQLDAVGLKMDSYKVGDPSDIVKTDKEMYVVVPFSIVMKGAPGTITAEGYCVGVSGDAGKTWKYVNGGDRNGEKLIQQILPNLPKDLKLPAYKDPKIEKN